MLKYLLTCLSLLFLNHGVLYALTLEQASNEIAEYFSQTDVQHESNTKIFIRVVNAYTKENDDTSQEIETGLKLAFANQFAEMEVSIGPGQNQTIQINANYRQRGIATLLQVTAYNTSTKNIILGSKITTFVFGEERKNKLAAILNITSAELTPDQKEDFGDDFRSDLSGKDLFDNIEIVDVDDFDIETIKKESNCADLVILDQCAKKIGIELKVDWVVSSNYLKISDEKYMLSAKILDIVNDTSLAVETLEHDGNLETLDEELNILADKLTAAVEIKPAPQRIKQPYIPKMITGRSRMPSRAELLAQSASGDYAPRATTNWHIWALTTAGVASTFSFIFAMDYNERMREAREAIEDGDYERYDNNVHEAKSTRHQYEICDGITVAALLWEAYLLIFSDVNFDGTLASFDVKSEIKPIAGSNLAETSLSFQWRW